MGKRAKAAGKATRRRFLAASAAAAAAVAMPQVSRAQTRVWRFQSTWAPKDIFHEFALDYAGKVNALSGNRLKFDVLAASSVVPPFQVQQAVHTGILDGGHGVCSYWYGRHKAFALFGSPPSFGWDAHGVLAWFYHGGGESLYKELVNDILKLNLVGFLCFPMPTQPLGWFKKEITGTQSFKGLKFRTVGLSAELFTEMGAAVTVMPAGQIAPSLERGLLDGAEFNNASSDRLLGFPDVSKVCMLQSYHQNAEQFEVIFNKTKYDSLPERLRTQLNYVAEAANADMMWKAIDRYSQDYIELQTKDKVKFYKTPDGILQKQLEIFDQVVAKRKDNALFVEILESQKKFAERAVRWDLDTYVSRRMAYNYYFGQKKPEQKEQKKA